MPPVFVIFRISYQIGNWDTYRSTLCAIDLHNCIVRIVNHSHPFLFEIIIINSGNNHIVPRSNEMKIIIIL